MRCSLCARAQPVVQTNRATNEAEQAKDESAGGTMIRGGGRYRGVRRREASEGLERISLLRRRRCCSLAK